MDEQALQQMLKQLLKDKLRIRLDAELTAINTDPFGSSSVAFSRAKLVLEFDGEKLSELDLAPLIVAMTPTNRRW